MPPVVSCVPLAGRIAGRRGPTPPAASPAALLRRGQRQTPIECQLPAASPQQRSLTTEQRTKTPVRAIGCWIPAAGRTTQPVRGLPRPGTNLFVPEHQARLERANMRRCTNSSQLSQERGFPLRSRHGLFDRACDVRSQPLRRLQRHGHLGGRNDTAGLDLDGEFDPGSGRTLAARFIHASRTNPRLRSQWGSGERVSNT